MTKARSIEDRLAQFEVGTEILPNVTTPCHNWTGKAKTRFGYGVMCRSVNGVKETLYPHRVVLEKKLGRPLGDNMVTMHICDNPSCINPDHLMEGTRSDNQQDALAKGRKPRGEQVWIAKLTEDNVREILASQDRATNLAARFDVAPSVIYLIRKGQIWKHIYRHGSSRRQHDKR